MSPECSSFTVLQSQIISSLSLSSTTRLRIRPLSSALATIKRVLLIVEHLSPDRINTKPIRLSIIPKDRFSAFKWLVIRRPCSVITMVITKALLISRSTLSLGDVQSTFQSNIMLFVAMLRMSRSSSSTCPLQRCWLTVSLSRMHTWSSRTSYQDLVLSDLDCLDHGGMLKHIVCAYVVSLRSEPWIRSTDHTPARIMDHVSRTYGRYHQLLTIQRSLLTSRRIWSQTVLLILFWYSLSYSTLLTGI